MEVNGELLETTYISPTTLLLNDVELKDGDEVDVCLLYTSTGIVAYIIASIIIPK